ncbi:MAG: ISKra4 family transposase [Deltaproteobacteria bacterium]|nr:ISKra4 family transposase [Deltaproteobacteria bacterium]
MHSLQLTTTNPQPLFTAADVKFMEIKRSLTSDAMSGQDAAAVEGSLREQGFELMRLLFQDHLNWRNCGAVDEPVIGYDGRPRTHVRQGNERDLMTAFGRVEVVRPLFGARNARQLSPHDAALNLPTDLYSFPVRKEVALQVAQTSFDSSIAAVERTSAAHVPKRQAEELVVRATTDFNAFYKYCAFGVAPEATSELLILSVDRKGVVMVPRDLTEETRKRAEASKPKLDTRKGKGEKDNRKRMAIVAAVYTVAPHVRTPEQVVAGLRHVRDATRTRPPKPEHKRVWATLDKSVEEVVRDLFDEADLRDPERTKTCYAMVDGESGLEKHINAEAKLRGRKVTVVLDFIHAVEYLWRASTAFHDEGDAQREKWVLERLTKVLHGNVSDVAAGMAHSATLRKLTEKQRLPVDKAVAYLTKRKDMMPYGELLAAGTPIASGVIEGACRHLICDRLEVSGARWSLQRAEAVMQLRALVANGDFEPYWQYHELSERQRNHDLRYQGGKPPEVKNAKPGRHLRLIQGGKGASL